MIKELIAVISLIAAISSFTATNAEVWSPTGPFAIVNVGDINFSKGSLEFSCRVFGSGLLDGDSASLTSIVFSGGPLGTCGAIRFEGLPYNIEATSATAIVFQNFNAGAFDGLYRCIGDLAATFDQASGQFIFIDATLPDVVTPSADPCIISGTITTNPQVSYTFP